MEEKVDKILQQLEYLNLHGVTSGGGSGGSTTTTIKENFITLTIFNSIKLFVDIISSISLTNIIYIQIEVLSNAINITDNSTASTLTFNQGDIITFGNNISPIDTSTDFNINKVSADSNIGIIVTYKN